MTKFLTVLITLAMSVCAGITVTADDDNNQPEDMKPPKASESTIRADKMDFDFEAGKIFMEGNVVVTDPDMTIRSQEMTVFLADDNRMEKVVAEGNVRIVQPEEDRTANAEHAVYEVERGTVTLTKNPSVKMRDNTLDNAEKIVFHRGSSRVETFGSGTKLHLPSEDGQPSFDLQSRDDETEEDTNDSTGTPQNDD